MSPPGGDGEGASRVGKGKHRKCLPDFEGLDRMAEVEAAAPSVCWLIAA